MPKQVNHVVLPNSLAVESGLVSMRMTKETMKTVPVAETQTLLFVWEREKWGEGLLSVFHQQILILSELPGRADGVQSKFNPRKKRNHFPSNSWSLLTHRMAWSDYCWSLEPTSSLTQSQSREVPQLAPNVLCFTLVAFDKFNLLNTFEGGPVQVYVRWHDSLHLFIIIIFFTICIFTQNILSLASNMKMNCRISMTLSSAQKYQLI